MVGAKEELKLKCSEAEETTDDRVGMVSPARDAGTCQKSVQKGEVSSQEVFFDQKMGTV